MVRAHSQIVRDAGGATAVAGSLFPLMPAGRWGEIKDLANTVQGWVRADSVPPEYWPAFVQLGLASLEEMAAAIAAARLPGHGVSLEGLAQ